MLCSSLKRQFKGSHRRRKSCSINEYDYPYLNNIGFIQGWGSGSSKFGECRSGSRVIKSQKNSKHLIISKSQKHFHYQVWKDNLKIKNRISSRGSLVLFPVRDKKMLVKLLIVPLIYTSGFVSTSLVIEILIKDRLIFLISVLLRELCIVWII